MPLYFLGSLLVVMQAAIARLSRSFIFGQGHAGRPILSFLILELASFAAYFAALEWVRRLPAKSFPRKRESGTGFPIQAFGNDKLVVFWIFLAGILCRVVLLPSNLIQESDPYRYIWDGQTVIQGANPYEHSPRDAFRNQQPPADGTQPEAVETFQRINHAGVKTIYPPLAQFLFAASQGLSPWNLMGWKLMVLGAEIGILLLLALIIRDRGLRPEWLALYAWSPLVLKEFSNSLHADVFAVLFLCGAMLAVARERIILSYVLLALSALTKFFPLVLLPAFFAWTCRQDKKRSVLGGAAFLGITGLCYLPFLSAGPQLFEGMGRFAAEWRVNEGLFGVIRLALTFFGSHAEAASRIVAGAGVLTAVYLAIRRFWESPPTADFFKAGGVILASLFFFAPTGNPWYFTWVLPFLAFFPLRSLILFSGLVFLYYLDFYFIYRGSSEQGAAVKLIEYGAFYLLLGWELWKLKSPLLCRSSTKELLSAAR